MSKRQMAIWTKHIIYALKYIKLYPGKFRSLFFPTIEMKLYMYVSV
jgi:hypothetical protein